MSPHPHKGPRGRVKTTGRTEAPGVSCCKLVCVCVRVRACVAMAIVLVIGCDMKVQRGCVVVVVVLLCCCFAVVQSDVTVVV